MLPSDSVKQAWGKPQMPRVLTWDLGLRWALASIFPWPLGFLVLGWPHPLALEAGSPTWGSPGH